MDNKRLIFVTGPAGCGKTANGPKLAEHFGCEIVVDEGTGREITRQLMLASGNVLVLTAAPEDLLNDLFPGSKIFHYYDACKAAGLSPFHLPNGQLNPNIAASGMHGQLNTAPLTASLAASAADAQDLIRQQIKMAPHLHAVLNEITKERGRQVGKGFDSSHDDRYINNELPQAAVSYTLNAALPQAHVECPFFWPWAVDTFRPEGRRADLIKAAALLVAEIERMDRAIAAKTTGTIDSWEPGEDDLQLARDAENEGDL